MPFGLSGLSVREADAESPSQDSTSSANVSSDSHERASPSHSPSRSSRRSSSRSRSPGHRHRSHSRRRRIRFKQKERNFMAAVCSMMVIVVLSTAMAEPDWFFMRGGGCKSGDNKPVHKLGVYQFFYAGHFEHITDTSVEPPRTHLVYHYSANHANMLTDCVTARTVQVLQSIIALCFIGILLSLMAFFLDLSGPTGRMMKVLRRNAVFNILTVVVCVTINGFSFLVTQLLESLQNETKLHHYSKVEIRFDVSFYLIAAAGGLSVIAAACNLLRRYPPFEHSEQRENLLDDYDGMDFIGLPQSPDYYAPLNFIPPPPAYAP